MSTSSIATTKVRVSTDNGTTWKDYVEEEQQTGTTTTTPPSPPPPPIPEPGPLPGGAKSIALIMHANWLTNSEFDEIAKGNVNENDMIRMRCTRYPEGWDEGRWKYIKDNYKAKTPGLTIGVDIAYYDRIVKYASEIKGKGADFVEYNLENGFDGPNDSASAQKCLDQIKEAADAVHKAGMTFKVAPGKPNSKTFKEKGMLDDIANIVDQYHIQAQSIQRTDQEYADFTEGIVKGLRAAKPDMKVTSQVSPHQDAAQGKTLLQTMQEAAVSAMQKPPPGNTNGVGMWIPGDDISVDVAADFFKWFRTTWP